MIAEPLGFVRVQTPLGTKILCFFVFGGFCDFVINRPVLAMEVAESGRLLRGEGFKR